jgi:hypothetical protein
MICMLWDMYVTKLSIGGVSHNFAPVASHILKIQVMTEIIHIQYIFDHKSCKIPTFPMFTYKRSSWHVNWTLYKDHITKIQFKMEHERVVQMIHSYKYNSATTW